ncbi:MAG: HslU--HslV peptidase ATPase subunit [Zetaproteobacteria bacterium CG_4_9_14_3_um_filter_49_83]|nr:MAG: HslU--HslV peptidase ATPase subunit [Zetaproteobacteria bacterium CG1_02_49_23]PIQ32310.1 MAG: HslU--HslV peptidase ATPase subunit [Zetaproteobacteria bacterium CG17_big_fil_post_rev_8_21_14_2_50_50_13]PIY56996.1 MAG: HslU--HslV peptidase ATPase subunit [Zetaproteobacteria bacterium CG_4_10_14_0_8_um_filter_49_80]PJA34663.1 MAG: HslU--HslV peptidase ATPase subunit [Zetaproteobacteria bacterium CG_4_9_14_3_um_filter_49_83]
MFDTLSPKQIVTQLDRHIVGQAAAKRAVAIALRNRWRRLQVNSPMREEITPKNILMIGPTGVGKTEIARRLAALAKAPLIKVEATKYTEIGYVGRDVESIIRDLLDIAISMVEEEHRSKVQTKARQTAEEKLLDILIPHPVTQAPTSADAPSSRQDSREKMRRLLQLGELGDRQVEIDVHEQLQMPMMQVIPGQNPNDMDSGLKDVFSNLFGSGPKKRKRMSVRDALKVLQQQESEQLIDQDKIKQDAISLTENSGIVFIDEMDKITHREGKDGNISREGVQRDLLPLVEGTAVSTRNGVVHTDHILFIASGAFHLSKPSDLIPELQGRFPIRVNLDALSEDDFRRILVEPEASLTRQYAALLETEDVTITFTDDGIEAMAKIAVQVNNRTENIGARRLHTLLEHVLEDISFNGSECPGVHVEVNAAYVHQQLGEIAESEDLSRYIL